MAFNHHHGGFTLAELLVALAIFGTIATFTIPKVLVTVDLKKRYALAQETAATLMALTKNYADQNGGCFPGDLTYSFDRSSGAVQDGRATSSTADGGTYLSPTMTNT